MTKSHLTVAFLVLALSACTTTVVSGPAVLSTWFGTSISHEKITLKLGLSVKTITRRWDRVE
jgi:hypothetical protein